MAGFSVRKPSTCATYRELSEYHNHFQCLVCLEPPVNPLTLPCGHTFCENCLQFYGQLFADPGSNGSSEDEVSTHSSSGGMVCPTCRSAVPTTEDGHLAMENDVDSAARNRKISLANDAAQRCDVCIFRRRVEEADFYCGKCSMNFCSGCKTAHDQHHLFKGHTVIHIGNKDTINLYCDEHSKAVCVYFCIDCDFPCCTVCVLLEHRTHRATKIHEALASRRDIFKTILNQFSPLLDKLEAKLQKLTEILTEQGKMGSASKTGNGEINSTTVVNGTDVFTRRSTGGLFFLNGDCRSQPSDGISLRSVGTRVRFMSRSNETVDQKESCQTFMESMNKQLANHRKLFTVSCKLLEMSQSRKLLAVYKDMLARIQTVIDDELPRMQKDVSDLIFTERVSLSQPINGYSTEDPDSNSSLPSIGRGRNSSGVSSEFLDVVNVYTDFPSTPSILIRPKLIWKVEKQRSDLGDLLNPCGAAFLPEHGSLIVAEYDITNAKNNKLRIYDKNGKSDAILAQGEIQPLGVAMTRDGHVAVTDCKGKRVRIITLNGQTVAEIGKGQFGWPYGITVNSRGQLIVTDAFGDSVSIFSPEGKRLRQIGTSGTKGANFRNPYHVAVDAQDNILVSDFGNHCIKIFDSSGGKLITTFSETGTRRISSESSMSSNRKKFSRRSLKGPRGVSVDMKGNILVADEYSRICMFDSAGKFVRNVLTDEDAIKFPEVVLCDSRGLLAVTEFNLNNMFAVKVFKLYE